MISFPKSRTLRDRPLRGKPLRSIPSLVTLLTACLGIGIQVHAETKTPPEPPIDPQQREHWAYKPLAKVEIPSVEDPSWNANPVDSLLRTAMVAQNVEPMPRVGRTTLLRRLAFDLTGLPPTPSEIAAFTRDNAPDYVDRAVDRLLASPAYGERYAQHWLDLARFAETDGFEHDLVRPNAWRYRDWVIDAFNRDIPYDDFVRMQLAGDELHPHDPSAAIATGFLLCGPDMPDINSQDERRHFVLNEMAATVGSVFLGLQFGCAQCHDHKFDALTQYDFYRMRAFFESASIFKDHPIPSPQEKAARNEAESALPEEIQQKRRRRDELERAGRQTLREKNPDLQPTMKDILAVLRKSERKEHAAITKELEKTPGLPKLPLGRVMRPGEPRTAHLFVRGDFRRAGPIVSCGYPRVLQSLSEDPQSTQSPRGDLANWLVRSDNPLATRVIANRIWQWHFGIGLCATPSDFGVMGDLPTNPQLLDWLATRFIEDGRSFRAMHRLIVTTQAYQLATAPFDSSWSDRDIASAKQIWKTSHERDPKNKRMWHRSRLRLDGESIRDAMLAACGQLSSRRAGPAIRPPLPPEVTQTLLKNQWPVNGDRDDHHRRSIYLFVRRNLRYPLFDVFDRPDTNASCPIRHESTTATQSLVLFNSEFTLACAQNLANMLLANHPSDPREQIAHAYLRILNRQASDAEIEQATAFLTAQARTADTNGIKQNPSSFTAGPPDSPNQTVGPNANFANPHSTALTDLCLALFNASEFVYLD